MRLDVISEVGIDAEGRLLVTPGSERFRYIYREAMEVHWDEAGGFLFSPKPREWSYAEWFSQILAAAQMQGCALRVSESTRWRNIPSELMAKMKARFTDAWRS